jgi:hypothetical protein
MLGLPSMGVGTLGNGTPILRWDRNTWEHLPRSGFALVRKKRPFRSMTHFKPRFGGAFFALRKARSTVARGGHNPSRFQEPEVLLLVGGVAELRATRWCAERLSKKGPASGGRGFKVDGVRHLKAPVSPSPPIPQRCIRFQLGEAI